MRTTEFFQFIKVRHAIWVCRERGEPAPWTEDPILQKFRFCNVYRELDKVTIWIREHWRTPHATDPDLWFALTVARFFNLPATLATLGYPVPYRPAELRKRLKKLTPPVFNAAYMVRSDPGDKIDYVLNAVLAPMWKARKDIWAVINNETLGTIPPPTLADIHSVLSQYYGMGSFMAAQVIADLKYVAPLNRAKDWWTWAAPGPGSMRGLNRVCGYPTEHPWKDGQVNHWLSTLQKLQSELAPLLQKVGMPRMCAQNTQNACCEFDKYERARTGEGRPKQLYRGSGI